MVTVHVSVCACVCVNMAYITGRTRDVTVKSNMSTETLISTENVNLSNTEIIHVTKCTRQTANNNIKVTNSEILKMLVQRCLHGQSKKTKCKKSELSLMLLLSKSFLSTQK